MNWIPVWYISMPRRVIHTDQLPCASEEPLGTIRSHRKPDWERSASDATAESYRRPNAADGHTVSARVSANIRATEERLLGPFLNVRFWQSLNVRFWDATVRHTGSRDARP